MKKTILLSLFVLASSLLSAQINLSVKILSSNSFAFSWSGTVAGPLPATAQRILFADVLVDSTLFCSYYGTLSSATIGNQLVSEVHCGYNNGPYGGSIQFRVPSNFAVGDTVSGCDTVVFPIGHGLTQSMFAGQYSVYWGRNVPNAGTFQGYANSGSGGNITFPQGPNPTFCNDQPHTLQEIVVVGDSGATFTWYDAPGGGNSLAPTDTLQDGVTYYVEQSGSGCIVSRASVTVTLNTVAPPTFPQGNNPSFCNDQPHTLQEIVISGDSGATFTWYDAPVGGNMLALTDTLADGQSYYASQNVAGCNSSRVPVTVSLITTGPPVLPQGNSISFCAGDPALTLQDVNVTGDSGAVITWYDSPAGGNSLAITDTLLDGNTYYVGQSLQGCDGPRISLTVTEISLDTTVTLAGSTLTATASGLQYQWIDCNGNVPISGETNQSFTATANGFYAVILDNGTCTDTSSCVEIDGITGLESPKEENIRVYPNPATDFVVLETPLAMRVQLLGLEGRVLQEVQVESGTSRIDLLGFPVGVYLLKLHNNSSLTVKKILKQ